MREIDNNKPVNNIINYTVVFYEEEPEANTLMMLCTKYFIVLKQE